MELFAGALSIGADAPLRTNGNPRHATREFPGGFLSYDPSLPIAEEDGALCLACGEPRFLAPELDDVARRQGNASAWIAAYRRSGDRAPSQAHGRFSIVVVFPAQRRVMVATDRFGTWPVCYSHNGSTIAFSDRATSVPGASDSVSPQQIFNYLFFHFVPAPRTIFEGTHRLPAAHALEWTTGSAREQAYWTPRLRPAGNPDLASKKAEFLEIVRTSVQREAEGANTGSFLSGGTDSSTVAGMLAERAGHETHTYAIGFAATGYDESSYARIASSHFGTNHHEYYVTPSDIRDGLPKIATYYDQPFGNSSVVPAWICASRAREDGIEKLLAGDGGDELFGGNARYAKQRVFAWYDSIPQSIRKGVMEPLSRVELLSNTPILSKVASYIKQASLPMPERLESYNLLSRIGTSEICEPGFLSALDAHQPQELRGTWWNSLVASSLLDHMLAFDWKFTLADNDLPKVIGATRLAGLDVGFPLLTDELVEFSMTLPPEWKLRGFTLRWFFKEALRDFLPEEILRKKKHGFGLPFGVWVQQHAGLATLVSDSLNELGKRRIVRTDFIDRLQSEYLPSHPGYFGDLVWILVVLELWLQSYAPDWKLE